MPLAGGFDLSVRSDGADVAVVGDNPVVVPLYDAARYTVGLTALHHDPLTVDLVFDGGDGAGSVHTEGGDPMAGVAIAHDVAEVDGREVWVHRVYLGLRHRWFSASGPPARHENDVELLVGGQEAWGRVSEDLSVASDTILLSTWWWESTFELVRSERTTTLAERRANTILETLRRSPALKRVIVGQFLGQDGLLTWLNTDADLRTHGPSATDSFELMGQANETRGRFWFEVTPFSFLDRIVERVPNGASPSFEPVDEILSDVPPHEVDLTAWPVDVDVEHASYHQKFIVIDDDVAYVGGANLRRTDWDTSEHLVYDPRRMSIDATDAERAAVVAHTRLPDDGPRRDYMVRIDGPAARDVSDVFRRRWDFLLASHVQYSENATSFTVGRDPPRMGSGVDVQITTTLPAPFDEHSIAESWFNAIGNAERYIYIEDQYFRIPMLVDTIIERMHEMPDLRLVIVTKPVDEWLDPGCYWTYRTAADLQARFPDRILLLQLRSFATSIGFGIDETDERFTDIDTHSKILIVDDVFMSVGSANANNRGIVYEGEMNAAIVDEAWVRAARRRILANLLPPGTIVSDDPGEWYGALERAATWNQYVVDQWAREGGDLDLDGAPLPARFVPSGFVYPLAFRDPAECLIEGIGPDMM